MKLTHKLACLLLAAAVLFSVFAIPVSAVSGKEIRYNFNDRAVIAAEDCLLHWDSVSGAVYYTVAVKTLQGQIDVGNDNERAVPGYDIKYSTNKRNLNLSKMLIPGKYLKVWVGAYNFCGKQICGKSLYLICKNDTVMDERNPYFYVSAVPLVAIERGSASSVVQWVQAALNIVVDDMELALDGSCGPLTISAVNRFQHSRGIGVTKDYISPATLSALMKALEEHGIYAPTVEPKEVDEDFYVYQQNTDSAFKNLPVTNGNVEASGCGPMSLLNALNYMRDGAYSDEETAAEICDNIIDLSGCSSKGVVVGTMLKNCQAAYNYEYIGWTEDISVGDAFSTGAPIVGFIGIKNSVLRNRTESQIENNLFVTGSHVICIVAYRIRDGIEECLILDSCEKVTSGNGKQKYTGNTVSHRGYWVKLSDIQSGFGRMYFILVPDAAKTVGSASVTTHSPKNNPEREETTSAFFSAFLDLLPGYTKVKD